MTALFEDVIFGPIRSRRLGLSLGVNLLPQHAKICNFDCIYCECGDNHERRGEAAARRFADPDRVITALTERLTEFLLRDEKLDVITFAGNGEPTLHPKFEEVIEATIELRNRLAPEAKISVLSNANNLTDSGVVRALHRVDNNILKLDSAIEATAAAINRPTNAYSVAKALEGICEFRGEAIVQTMFLRGKVADCEIDNTTEEELTAWLSLIEKISPRSVMIYSIDRDTPCEDLQRVTREELEVIAARVRALNIECSVA